MAKKILIGLGVILFVGATFLWYLGGQTLASQPTIVEAGDGIKKLVYPDTDSDGLPDWEEELWQTEKKNPDTDGDGVTDREEISLGRDPNGNDPNDELTEPEEKLAVVVRNAVEQKEAPLVNPQPSQLWRPVVTFTANDLTLSDNKTATIKAYGENFRQTLNYYVSHRPSNELKILLSYLDNRTAGELGLLNQAADNYRQTINQLRAQPVPPSATELHLKLLNRFVALAEVVYNMQKVVTEPVLALESGQLYPTRFLLVLRAIVDLNSYFVEQKITFDPATTPKLIIDF